MIPDTGISLILTSTNVIPLVTEETRLANEKATECRPANQDVNVLEGGRPGIDVKDVAGAGSVGKLQPRILHPSNT